MYGNIYIIMLDTIKRPIAYRKRTITHVSSCIWEETWHPKEKGFRAGEFHDMRGKNLFFRFFRVKKEKEKKTHFHARRKTERFNDALLNMDLISKKSEQVCNN